MDHTPGQARLFTRSALWHTIPTWASFRALRARFRARRPAHVEAQLDSREYWDAHRLSPTEYDRLCNQTRFPVRVIGEGIDEAAGSLRAENQQTATTTESPETTMEMMVMAGIVRSLVDKVKAEVDRVEGEAERASNLIETAAQLVINTIAAARTANEEAQRELAAARVLRLGLEMEREMLARERRGRERSRSCSTATSGSSARSE